MTGYGWVDLLRMDSFTVFSHLGCSSLLLHFHKLYYLEFLPNSQAEAAGSGYVLKPLAWMLKPCKATIERQMEITKCVCRDNVPLRWRWATIWLINLSPSFTSFGPKYQISPKKLVAVICLRCFFNDHFGLVIWCDKNLMKYHDWQFRSAKD